MSNSRQKRAALSEVDKATDEAFGDHVDYVWHALQKLDNSVDPELVRRLREHNVLIGRLYLQVRVDEMPAAQAAGEAMLKELGE